MLMLKKITASMLILLLSAILCSCAPVDNAPVEADSHTELTATEVFAQFSESVVHIETSSGGGTGFFVEENIIATNRHVVADAGWVTIRTVNGEEYNATSILSQSE